MVKLIPVSVACCGFLTSNQNVLICAAHIKKVIARLYFFILRSKITEKNNRSEISAEVRNFASHRMSLRPNIYMAT